MSIQWNHMPSDATPTCGRAASLQALRRRLRRGATAALLAPLIALLVRTPILSQAPDVAAAVETEPKANASFPPARLLLVVGAAGTAEYGQQFGEDAQRWRQLAESRQIDLVEVREEGDRSQSEHLQAAIAEAQDQTTAQLWIVFIGHGTSERGVHKFNLNGVDVSSRELAQWLRPLTRPVIFVNCSSASAPFLPELSGPGRVIVTATRSGSENNYSRFGNHLAASLLDPSTDIDHDEEVSLLEAFLAASAKTEQFYREQSRLTTEHALIDDNGDKLGTGAEFFRGTRAVKAAQDGKALDGQVAAKIILYSDPALPQLGPDAEARRAEIETQIEQLRARKPNPPTAAYWDELEKLLLELAQLYADAP